MTVSNEVNLDISDTELPLSWDSIFQDTSSSKGKRGGSISDALIMSLTNLGKVDIEYISSITGESCRAVISALKGSIYQNPETWN